MKFALLGAAGLAAAALVTPAKAQEVIYNPGRCAQFYPNANCQNLGLDNPYQNRPRVAGVVAMPIWAIGSGIIITTTIIITDRPRG